MCVVVTMLSPASIGARAGMNELESLEGELVGSDYLANDFEFFI